MRIEAWSLWWANIRYRETPDGFKRRPVLVMNVNDSQMYVLVLKITSHPKREWDAGDYELVEWRLAGLDRPSTVRASQVFKLAPADMGEYIGRLQPGDISALRNVIVQMRGD